MKRNVSDYTKNMSKEYYFKEGCYITELRNTPDDPAVSVARVRVLPGETTRWHALRETTERYLILEGSGIFESGEKAARKVQAGDVVMIPADTSQRITNNGTNDLIFLAVCTPRFTETNYIDLSNQLSNNTDK